MIPWNLICAVALNPDWFKWASACVPNKEASDEDEMESGVIAMSGRAGARSVKNSMRDAMKKKLDAAILEDKQKSGSFKHGIN